MMKPRRALTSAALCAAMLAWGAGDSTAYHRGGVARCGDCHIMHGSEAGMPIPAGLFLLRHGSATDSCLSCHASGYGEVVGLDPINPPPEKGGGNFIFLKEENLNDASDGAANPVGGHRAGHNVVSPGWDLVADPEHSVAPGGSYLSSDLSCTSCHDPHGNRNFRLLYGAGQTVAGGFVFSNPAPAAEGIDIESGQETRSSHSAYRAGWADWCANCHGYYHDSGEPGFAHPTRDEPLSTEHSDSYNRYNGEADPDGGSFTTAYLAEVPFQDSSVTPSSTSGPSPSSRVSCITCHRAHASSAPSAGRWDFNVLYLDEDGLVSGSYPIPNPYPGPGQRSLCIKCHVSGTRDHGLDRPCMECHRQN